MKTIKLLQVFCCLIFLFNAGCTYAIRYDGTYQGKVIDAETGQPIEGAVVLGVWYKEYAGAAGTSSEFYDAREAVTDNSGDFSIPGMGLRIMSNLAPMNFLIFKSGYEHLGSMMWVSLKKDILLSKKIKWEGNKPILPLRKLTYEERKKQLADKETIPDNKQLLLIHEVNKERKELGFLPYPEENIK